jgi:hypothetical protein
VLPASAPGIVTGTVTFVLKGIFVGRAPSRGLSTNMYGGSSVSILTSLGNLTPGPGKVKFMLGLLPPTHTLPCGVKVTDEWYIRATSLVGIPSFVKRFPRGRLGVYKTGVKMGWSAFPAE